jgi:hypothetical protein
MEGVMETSGRSRTRKGYRGRLHCLFFEAVESCEFNTIPCTPGPGGVHGLTDDYRSVRLWAWV